MNGTISGRLSCRVCGGMVVTTSRGFDCPRCSGPVRVQRAREIAELLVMNGMDTALGGAGVRRWTIEQAENAHTERETLTAELLALVLEGRGN